jgi:type 1 glutamine amidotransferase
MSRRALVTWGGWDGHRPEECAAWTAELLRGNGFDVTVTDSLAALLDPSAADELDLLVPVWSIADAPDEELDALVALVARGTGLAAFHGAAATFRRHQGYHRVVGGQFVWHPEELAYDVELADGSSFGVHTEQYYLHVDPANEVVATTRFGDGTVMPVAWRRQWGEGRVFYSSLGHAPDVLALEPVRALFETGALWAARG